MALTLAGIDAAVADRTGSSVKTLGAALALCTNASSALTQRLRAAAGGSGAAVEDLKVLSNNAAAITAALGQLAHALAVAESDPARAARQADEASAQVGGGSADVGVVGMGGGSNVPAAQFGLPDPAGERLRAAKEAGLKQSADIEQSRESGTPMPVAQPPTASSAPFEPEQQLEPSTSRQSVVVGAPDVRTPFDALIKSGSVSRGEPAERPAQRQQSDLAGGDFDPNAVDQSQSGAADVDQSQSDADGGSGDVDDANTFGLH